MDASAYTQTPGPFVGSVSGGHFFPGSTTNWAAMAMDRDKEYGQQLKMGTLQNQPAMLKLQQDQSRFNQLFPYLQNAMGSGNISSKVGGQSTAGPRISAGGVYNPVQIQAANNAIRDRGNTQTAGDVQQMQNRMAGSGFGANSPAAMAMQTGMQMGNRANQANQMREFGQGAAQLNAAQRLKGQTAQEQQHANRMQEDIERRRVTSGYQSNLLGMLGQFI